MVNITVKTDNSAFFDEECLHNPAQEVARILEVLAWRIREEGLEPYVLIMDVNGNAVGSMRVCDE